MQASVLHGCKINKSPYLIFHISAFAICYRLIMKLTLFRPTQLLNIENLFFINIYIFAGFIILLAAN